MVCKHERLSNQKEVVTNYSTIDIKEVVDTAICQGCGKKVIIDAHFSNTKPREPVEMYDPDRWGTRANGETWKIPGLGWYTKTFDDET